MPTTEVRFHGRYSDKEYKNFSDHSIFSVIITYFFPFVKITNSWISKASVYRF